MTAPHDRIRRFVSNQKLNLKLPIKKVIKVPLKLLRQVGGKRRKRKNGWIIPR